MTAYRLFGDFTRRVQREIRDPDHFLGHKSGTVWKELAKQQYGVAIARTIFPSWSPSGDFSSPVFPLSADEEALVASLARILNRINSRNALESYPNLIFTIVSNFDFGYGGSDGIPFAQRENFALWFYIGTFLWISNNRQSFLESCDASCAKDWNHTGNYHFRVKDGVLEKVVHRTAEDRIC